MESNLYNQEGKITGKINVSDKVFGLPWKADLVHEVVRLMNSNARQPIAHTKTRGEVRGGGKKPWQQKGTGRARHGSSRSPIWVGGGITHGPRSDKNFSRKINRKAKTLALFSILSRKYKDGEILFVDELNLSSPKTQEAKKIINSLATIKGYEKLTTKPKNAAIIALDKPSKPISKSFNNFGNIAVEEFRNLNPVSVLNHRFLILTNPEAIFKKMNKEVAK